MSHESPEQGTRSTEIARLNDEFRQRGPIGGDWYTTPGVREFPDVPNLVEAVRVYTDFTEAIDPHGEHDMGRIMWRTEKTYWKIDYYDQALQYGLDPLDPACRRVMTIMLASEY